MNRHFIRDLSEYSDLRARFLTMFRADRHLPDRVFSNGFEDFRFLEFDLMIAEVFWDILSSLAAGFGDTEVIFNANEPDADAYYFTHFHRYGALRFDPTDSALDYYSALRAEPAESPADALLYVTNIASWFGNSENWAFWGERDLGIGVAAVRERGFSWPEAQGIKWFDLESALSDLVAINFRDALVPSEFSVKLRENYANR